MSNYNTKLTPNFIDPTTEGSLDSSILNGKSIQRTFNMCEVVNNGNRKMISVKDGETFNDTTFQDSSGIGSFEAGGFAFDSNYVGNFIALSNNNSTCSFTDDSATETTVLTNTAIKVGEKAVFSMVTIYGGYDDFTGVGIANLQCDLNSYLGTDTNSAGFWDTGSFYFDGGYESLSLNFPQDNSVVDVAVDRVNNLMWCRVNGGYWNGDSLANPETQAGGVDISGIAGDVYPGACPYAYQGVFGQISINDSVISPPAGFKVLVSSQQVELTGNYYFNGNEDDYWDNLNNWWLDGISTVPATTLPTSSDNVKIYSNIQNNSGSVPSVQNMWVSAMFSGETDIGIEISVSGTARFYNYTYIYNDDGYPKIAKINGNCIFYGDDSGPYISENIADAVVNGNATFYEYSHNVGTITGNAVFNDASKNYFKNSISAIVNGNAIFNDTSDNHGIVEGNAIFNDSSNNNGTVGGTKTCNTTGLC